jgi:diguanylate cyclase (GGDEF)-like protein
MSQLRRDGSALTVESRYTIVRAEDGKPRSILAINTDITSRRAGEARIERLAFFDVLTGLPNRQLMRDRLNAMLLSGKLGALLYIELEDLKRLNNTMGHDIGDALLQQIAVRIGSCVRPGDTVARVGSDEFVVILMDLSEDARNAADVVQSAGDRILETFRQPFTVGSYECETTASIGATLFSGLADSIDLLLKRSGLAMHHAKTRGRKTVCFFDQGMQSDVESRAALRSDLRRALQKNEFELHYQPQVNIHGVVTGAEALLRWHHPMRGNIAPNVFIPLAEEAGFIVELGRWALETACFQLAKWTSHAALKKLTLAVNVSLRQFVDPWFLNLLRDALRISGANPHLLRLEFTESCIMENAEEMIAKMTEIKMLGIGFSLDDFGTGYSSLLHLKLLPLDELKIDRSFINDMLANIKGASIARTIILLGHNLDLTVIAEGVETLAQRDFLKSEGCDLYQGFLYSPAVTASELSAYVETAGGTKSGSWHIV